MNMATYGGQISPIKQMYNYSFLTKTSANISYIIKLMYLGKASEINLPQLLSEYI